MNANLISLQVRFTQRAIKQVLTERFYSWQDAEALAKTDPEIDLSGNGPIYTPSDFMEEELPEDKEFEDIAEAQPEQEQKTLSEPEVKPEQRVSPTA
jgi:large subunit ribosomal protein L47